MWPLWLLAVVVGAAAVFAVGLALFLTWAIMNPAWLRHRPGGKFKTTGRSVHPSWTHRTDPKTDFGIEFEDVEFTAGGRRGYKCRGWLVDQRQSSSTHKNVAVIFVHGGGRDRRAFLRHSIFVHKAGFSFLMYDSRGHGLSDGKTGLTMGVHEHKDAVAAVDFMASRGFTNVAMVGTSIGAVCALLAAHRRPQNVVGVAAENPFTDVAANIEGIVDKMAFYRVILRENKKLMWLCTPVRRATAKMTRWRIMSKIGPKAFEDNVQAINVMKHLAPPLLLMHGTADGVIDHSHTLELAKQASPENTEVWIAPDAGHTMLYNKHPLEFQERVLRLLSRAEEYAVAHPTAESRLQG